MEKSLAYDAHHVYFTRREMSQSPIRRRVRNLAAFVIKAEVVHHRNLHANMPPTPKLTHNGYHDLYNFMVEHEHEYQAGTIQGLEYGIIWANDRKEYELEEHLEAQLYYLGGYYEN